MKSELRDIVLYINFLHTYAHMPVSHIIRHGLSTCMQVKLVHAGES